MKVAAVEVLKTMGFETGGIDAVFLNVIGAVTAISKCYLFKEEVETAKYRVFFRTLKEITSREIKVIEETNEALNTVQRVFPDKAMEKDSRMWLPMHFAMAVPNVDLDNIQALFEHDPESIKRGCKRDGNVTPCHLAVMMKNPNMALIDRLKVFDPDFGARLTSDESTPLHLAAKYSNSVAVIQELIRVFPAALEMRDLYQFTPLSRCLQNTNPEAPDILQALIDAAPHTASLLYVFTNETSLFQVLRIHSNNLINGIKDELRTERMISILLKAFPGAMNMRETRNMMLPILFAAEFCRMEVLRLIVEADPAYSMRSSELAHHAVASGDLSKVRYLHSLMPSLLLSVDDKNRTPICWALIRLNCDYKFFQAVLALAPHAVEMVDMDSNTLLHIFLAQLNETAEPIESIDVIDMVRLLLRRVPGGALAVNVQGHKPVNVLDSHDCRYKFLSRILLMAGAPYLYPDARKQMNYEARKVGLFAFLGPRGKDRNSRMNICSRILQGAGATELMRHVISFL